LWITTQTAYYSVQHCSRMFGNNDLWHIIILASCYSDMLASRIHVMDYDDGIFRRLSGYRNTRYRNTRKPPGATSGFRVRVRMNKYPKAILKNRMLITTDNTRRKVFRRSRLTILGYLLFHFLCNNISSSNSRSPTAENSTR
jgi:hypothetical protein